MIHFITGDRAVPAPIMIPLVALTMLKIKNADPEATFMTGDNDGTESAVNVVGDATGIDVMMIATPRAADGSRDWDARHASLDPSVKITFIHGDPLSSSIGASLMRVAGDRTDMITPEMVIVVGDDDD